MFDHYSLPAFDDGRRPKREFGSSIKSTKFTVGATDVLLAKLNPHIPRVWLPELSSRRAVCSTEFLVLRPVREADRHRLYLQLSDADFLSLLRGMVTGTTGSHQRVSPEAILQLPVVVPTPPVAGRFDQLVGPALARLACARRESDTLADLRNGLLPDLISGKLRVSSAERILEDAAV
jgi:type I restriction enzyme S subunit